MKKWLMLDCGAMLLSSVCYAFSTVVKQWLFDTITDAAAGNTTYRALIIVTICVVLFQNALKRQMWGQTSAMRCTMQ